jgi:TM2 domain-containing membrane protein YozV
MPETKSSGAAIVLSFFWTGLGQLYAGRIARGLIMMVLTPIIWAIGWFDGFSP